VLSITISGATLLILGSISVFKTASAAPSFPLSSETSVQLSSVLQAATNSNLHPFLNISDKILSDQALINDKRPSLVALSDEGVASGSDQISVYIVREGDTLGTIADMFDVTQNTIRWTNNLSTKPTLKKDQELVILPISGVKYVIKKGDSLKSIAQSFNADTNEILTYNDLSSSELKAGVEIIIPNGEITTSVVTKSISVATNKGSSSKKGYLIRPVSGGVKTQGIHGRNGVDLAKSLGAPIIAAADGKVIIAKQGGWNGGYGNYVVISHSNGTQTLYAHLNTVKTSVGSIVSQGSTIGTMGASGQVTGPTGVHLHFEVRGGTNPF